MQSTCYFYQILIELEFPQHILKNTHMINLCKSSQWELSCSTWTDRLDGGTDMMKLKVTFHNSANIPKTCLETTNIMLFQLVCILHK